MNQSIEVVVSGHLCLDLLPEMGSVPLAELASPGRLFVTGPLDVSTGGAVSNTGLALHRLGITVRLMAKVGDDLLGQATTAFLQDRDPALAETITVQPGQASSYTVVLSPERSDRIFLHYPGPNSSFGQRDIDFAVLDHARIFHLGYPTILPRLMANNGQEMAGLYQQAKAKGVITALDTAMPDLQGMSGRVDWPAILTNTLPHVDIFVPSIEEILFMLRRADFDAWQGAVQPHLTPAYLAALAGELLDMGAVIAGFKLGELGMYLKTAGADAFQRMARLSLDVETWANAEVYAPAFAVDVVGTTGAGDSAYAGLLAGILRGMTPGDALRWACAVGACNVEAADATSGIRTWAETQARLDAGWPLAEARLPGTA